MKSIFSPTWRLFVALAFISGIGVLVFPQSGVVSQISGFLRVNGGLDSADVDELPENLAILSPENRLFIHGEDNSGSPQRRWKAVHTRNLNSPLHYARYLQQIEELPSDFHSTVSSLDPDNGWFDLHESKRIFSMAFSRIDEKGGSKDEWDRSIPNYKILDEAQLQKALKLFHKAASKKGFTNYGIEMQQLILNEREAPETWLEEISYRTNILSISTEYKSVISSGEFLGAAVQYLVAEDDQDGFLKLENSILGLAPKLHANSHELIGGLVLQAWLRSAYQNLEIGSQHFGLISRAKKYHDLRDKIESSYKERQANRNRPEQEELFKNHASIMMNLTSPLLFGSPQGLPVKADLLPSARAEHAVTARLFTFGWLVIFTLLAVDLWLLSRKSPKASDQPAKSSTYWQILFFGVIVPFTVLLLIRYLTPLGGLQYSASSSKFQHLAIPLTASGLFIWACTSVAAQFFTSNNRDPIRWFLFILVPAFPVILVGFYHALDKPKTIVVVCGLFLLGSILWQMIRAFSNLRRKDTDIYSQRRHALPCTLLAAGLFGLSTWGLTLEERAWIAKDNFGTPDGLFLSKHEARLVKTYLAELEELLP
ncbi:MAG: hypothetical protein ABF381_13290 [Akkermansiaceae bacterium]